MSSMPAPAGPANDDTQLLACALAVAVTVCRAGRTSGVAALDTPRVLSIDLDEFALMAAQGARPVPDCLDQVERAILMTLADIYGAEMLTSASLGYALRLLAWHGGVRLMQRVLWGTSDEDLQLAEILSEARTDFISLTTVFADARFAQARALLAPLMTSR
jgi:hypothetical protein